MDRDDPVHPLGTWVLDVPIAAVQVHLDAQSMRHAWHAELWGDRLPVLAGVDPDGLDPPLPATAALFDALDGVGAGGGGAGVDVAGRPTARAWPAPPHCPGWPDCTGSSSRAS